VLRKNFFSSEQLIAIVNDYHSAELEPAEIAMMSFAEKVVLDQHGIHQSDVDELRKHGFSDEEVLDIVLAASARSFYTKVLDSLGSEPDETLLNIEPELRAALEKGKPVIKRKPRRRPF
jgi:alkylhydroperoxidase family enzyme